MDRPMLDLYCCEGIGAWGYWSSGRFSEIDGVDINDMSSRYSFNFIRGNALAMNYEQLDRYSFIHASPPCQAYSKITPDKSKHMRLIAATHLMLQAAGKPYVIENVEGSGLELRPNLCMNGLYFGLPSNRRRYFYVSTLRAAERLIKEGKSKLSPQGDSLTRAQLIEAMGLQDIPEKRLKNLSIHGMEQAIPPIFTKTIAEMMFSQKVMIG